MIKLTDIVDKQMIEGYGFIEKSSDYHVKTIGALDIYVNWISREITGIGFYSVSDRIVADNITDLLDNKLAVIQ